MLFIYILYTGAAAIGVYTVCFVWAIESVSGRWKTFVAMGMNYAWPIGRYLNCVSEILLTFFLKTIFYPD